MKEKMRRYSFWTSLAGSIAILISVIGKFCGFEIENEIVSNSITIFAGVLVVFGIIIPDGKQNVQEKDLDDKNIVQNNEKTQKNNKN